MAKVAALFGIDARSLGLLRIVMAIGFLILLPVRDTISGGSIAAILLLVIALFAALALALGYRSRTAAAVLWAVGGSFVFVDASDLFGSKNGLIGILILLSAVPCGAVYSIDRAMGWVPQLGGRITCLATAAILVQIGLTLIAATVWQAADQPSASLVVLFIAALCVLIPAAAWNRLGDWATRFHSNGLRIYYDRDCGFCYKISLLFRTFLLLGDTPIAPAQSEPDVEKIMLEHNSWVVYDRDGTVHLRWHAVLLLLRRSALLRPLGKVLTIMGMGHWGDFLYATIAASRRIFSALTVRVLPLPAASRTIKPSSVTLPVVWLVATLVYNLYRAMVSDVGIIALIGHSAGLVGLLAGPS